MAPQGQGPASAWAEVEEEEAIWGHPSLLTHSPLLEGTPAAPSQGVGREKEGGGGGGLLGAWPLLQWCRADPDLPELGL